MKHNKNQITFMQYIFLIHGVQVGVGLLTLPRELAEIAGTDGWISIIIGYFLATVAGLLIIQVMKKYPNGTILDLLTHYFGKWIGKIAALVYGLYFAFLASIIFIRECLFIQFWILPQTDMFILMLLLSIPTYLIVRNNIKIIARYSQLVFFMTTWMIFFYFPPLKEAHWLHLLPVVKEGWIPIFTAVKLTIFSFIGFEIAFFLYPSLQKKQKASAGLVIANTLTLLILLTITIVIFTFFSPDEITQFKEPTISVLKIVEFKFLERVEIVFLSFYIFVISTTVLPLMYSTVFCLSQLFGAQNHSKFVGWYLLLNLVYIMFITQSFDRNDQLSKLVQPISLFLAYVFPICLLIYVSIHDRIKGRANL
ncbi:endospore germination permease [Neobacillus niacini]|uniref:GerAB/ArcD/ProY family transporter n=1 Tax=Neobacillus niacini TaxID=86668 RepID=UPI002FFF694E